MNETQEESAPDFANATKVEEAGEKKLPTVQMRPKATINWQDAEGNTTGTEDVFRSMPSLLSHLGDRAEKDEVPLDTKLEIILHPETVDGKEADDGANLDGKSLTMVVADGTLEEVMDKLAGRYIPANAAMQQIAALVAQLFDLSQLKGVLLTGVVGDGTPIGFGLINETQDVSPEDLICLGAAGTSQVESYKDAMRKSRKLKFPGDEPEGGIIVPGGFTQK